MVIAAIGCCGIKYYSRLLLALYVLIVLIIFIIQLTLALVFVTEHQDDIIGLKSDDSEQIKEVMTKSADAVVTMFFIVLFIEALVMFTASCFRSQLTGDELDQVQTKYDDLEEQKNLDKEKRKMTFEMRARNQAAKMKSGKGGFF